MQRVSSCLQTVFKFLGLLSFCHLVRFMHEVFLVGMENKDKAERILKADETVNRGSIILKSAASLDIDEEGYFLIIDCQPEAVRKAEELLAGIATKYAKKEAVLEKFNAQEDAAIEGFGKILGD